MDQQLAKAIASGERGVNTYFLPPSQQPDSLSTVTLFFDLANAVVPQQNQGGKKNKNQKSKPLVPIAVASCGPQVVLTGVTCSLTLSYMAAGGAVQADAVKGTRGPLQWITLPVGTAQYLAVTLDAAAAVGGVSPWSVDEEALGGGMLLKIRLEGRLAAPAPAPTPAPAPAPAPSTSTNRPLTADAVDEGIFHTSATMTNDTVCTVTVDTTLPPFFLDASRSIDEEPGTYTLCITLPNDSTLTFAVRRNTVSDSRNNGKVDTWTTFPITHGKAQARSTSIAGSRVLSVKLEVPTTTATTGWVPVRVQGRTVVDLSIRVELPADAPTTDAVADDETTYRVIYDLLRPQPEFGLPTLHMVDVFQHTAKDQDGPHDKSVVRDAVRRYIVSAMCGSPDVPRSRSRVGAGMTAMSIPSHDF